MKATDHSSAHFFYTLALSPSVLFLEQEARKATGMTWIFTALISSTGLPTGKERQAAETGSKVPRAQITASLGNQCCRMRGSPCARILNTSFTQRATGPSGPVLWTSCRSLVGPVCPCDRPFLPTSLVCSGHSTKETQSRKVGQEHKGQAFVSVPRQNLSFSNGTLGRGKSFLFYFHSKAPRIN